MDTFGIGGNISILHGVCDCHDIGRGLDAGPIWYTKIDPLYQIPAIAAFAIFGLSVDPWHVILGLFFMGMTSGAWPHGKTVLGRILWHATFGRAQGDGGGHYGAGIGDWAGLTGLFLDFGIGLSTQYLWVAAYFGVSTIIMLIGVRRYREEVPRTHAP